MDADHATVTEESLSLEGSFFFVVDRNIPLLNIVLSPVICKPNDFLKVTIKVILSVNVVKVCL